MKKQKQARPKRKRRRRRDEEHHGAIAAPQPAAQSDVGALQNQIGNAAVQRLLAERESLHAASIERKRIDAKKASVLRDAENASPINQDVVQRYRDPERRVPALTDSLVVQVEDEIAAGHRQNAINLVVNTLVGQGRINLAHVDGGRMRYDSGMSDEGDTVGYWDKDPALHLDAKPLPSEVKIGPPAFASVPWLYSTIIHEWRHLKQFRVHSPFPDRHIAIEVDAYLNGIEQAWASGQNTTELNDLWQRLNDDWWPNLTDAGTIAMFQPRYDAAQQYVERHQFSGDEVEREFTFMLMTQLFFETGSAELGSDANDLIADTVQQVQDFLDLYSEYDIRFTITGHASPRWKHPGAEATATALNEALSEERAKNTQEQLSNAFQVGDGGTCDFRIQSCVADGLSIEDPAADASVDGVGDSEALDAGRDMESDEQKDRRVEIEVEYSAGPTVDSEPPAILGGS